MFGNPSRLCSVPASALAVLQACLSVPGRVGGPPFRSGRLLFRRRRAAQAAGRNAWRPKRKFTFGRLVFYRIVTNILDMFDMSADPTDWTITLIVAVGFLGIVAIARWLLR